MANLNVNRISMIKNARQIADDNGDRLSLLAAKAIVETILDTVSAGIWIEDTDKCSMGHEHAVTYSIVGWFAHLDDEAESA